MLKPKTAEEAYVQRVVQGVVMRIPEGVVRALESGVRAFESGIRPFESGERRTYGWAGVSVRQRN